MQCETDRNDRLYNTFEQEILAICFLRDGWEDEDEDAGLKDG